MSEPRPVTRMSLEVPGTSPRTVAPELSPDGAWPVWARDGRELFSLSEDGLMAVSIETEPFRRGPSQPVFETTAYVVDNQFYRPYDVSIDAKRFLMMKSTSSDDRSGPTQIHFILNWFEELERLVPTQ